MRLEAEWRGVLEKARLGDLESARAVHEGSTDGGLGDYFYGRALAEAGLELDEAAACLRRAAEDDPRNPLIGQSLALALARMEGPEAAAEADRLWCRHGLPYEPDLLGQAALTLEALCRPWPPQNEAAEVPWPACLPRPEETPSASPPPAGAEDGGTGDAESSPESSRTAPLEPPASVHPNPPQGDKMSTPAGTKSPGFFRRRELTRAVGLMEDWLIANQPLKVLQHATVVLSPGVENAEVHLVAGLAAEEVGDPPRARAHLVRCEQLDPTLLMARCWLGRVYWRSGWFELARALWRSLPVEGPFDNGRHYHLALAHDALGDRAAALESMRVAMRDFYYDTYHFFIQRALKHWRAHQGLGGAEGRA